MGRLVGYYEQRRKGAGTPIDIPVENRNNHIRGRCLLIGCGGGFLQECGQPYSPVSDWIAQADIVLEDEGQQYGNMEEASTIARTPRTCLEIWSGDHRQTPGGLQDTAEAKKFRRKVLRRPLALRGETNYVQPHGLASIIARYVDGNLDARPGSSSQFLADPGSPVPAEVDQAWMKLFGQGPPLVDTQVRKAALAILTFALKKDDLTQHCAATYAEAAGLQGKQHWGLVLSSSARVTEMTYQTVIGVRYPELVDVHSKGCTFGRFVPPTEQLLGGFLPVFWDVPRSEMHATVDIGTVVDWIQAQQEFLPEAKSSLAVLHNRNRMVDNFKASSWVSEARGAVVTRGVTTCAGMTAHTVVLAQTRVGFLSGGRRASFQELPYEEQRIQLEEAYGRATVALTRARSLCIIMGPLDMKGLIGAATVIGSLMYGAGHVFAGKAHFYLHQGSLQESPTDTEFGRMLSQSCCLAAPHFPPLAIAEALQDLHHQHYKIRRLHLIVVDTWCPWEYNRSQVKLITDHMWRIANDPNSTRTVPMMPPTGRIPPRCRRFIFGYALDHSEFPCYLLWPTRAHGRYWLLDSMTSEYFPLASETFFRPLNLAHFYDAFALEMKADLRQAAKVQFQLEDAELTSDLRLADSAVARKGWGQHP